MPPTRPPETHHEEMSNFEAFLRLFKPHDSAIAPKRLLFCGELHAGAIGENLRFENDQAYAAAIRASKLVAPEEKFAVFLELPPEMKMPFSEDTLKLQSYVDNYLATGELPEGLEGKILTRFLPILKDAKRTGSAVFLIDDQKSMEGVFADQIKNSFQALKKPFSEKDLFGLGPEHPIRTVQNTLSIRNEVMAERVASILQGTNNEPAYAAQMKKCGFDRALVMNGMLHLSNNNDLDELTLHKLKGSAKFNAQTTYRLEIFKDKNAPHVVNAPRQYQSEKGFPLVGAEPEKPDASLNISMHALYDESLHAIDRMVNSLHKEATKTADKEDDAAITELRHIMASFVGAPNYKQAFVDNSKQIDAIIGLPESAQDTIKNIKTYMDILVKYEHIQELSDHTAVMNAFGFSSAPPAPPSGRRK